MINISIIRAAMLRNPNQWKWDSMTYDIVKIVTSIDPLFINEEIYNWMYIYSNVYCNYGRMSSINIYNKIHKLAPKDSPLINISNYEQLKEFIKLAGMLSFFKINCNNFDQVRWYNNSAYLPEDTIFFSTNKPTFNSLIKIFLKKYPLTALTIFDVIINDTREWFKTILIPKTELRIDALNEVLNTYDKQFDNNNDIIYWLTVKRFFSDNNNFLLDFLKQVELKRFEMVKKDPFKYSKYLKIETAFYKNIFNKCKPFLDHNNNLFNKYIYSNIIINKDSVKISDLKDDWNLYYNNIN
jgi:hypothetical protein